MSGSIEVVEVQLRIQMVEVFDHDATNQAIDNVFAKAVEFRSYLHGQVPFSTRPSPQDFPNPPGRISSSSGISISNSNSNSNTARIISSPPTSASH